MFIMLRIVCYLLCFWGFYIQGLYKEMSVHLLGKKKNFCYEIFYCNTYFQIHARRISSVGVLCRPLLLSHFLCSCSACLSKPYSKGGSRGYLAGGFCCVSRLRHDASKIVGGSPFWVTTLLRPRNSCSVFC